MPPLSGGGLMQLVAYGAQDIYLTANPSITFFKTTYRRDTEGSYLKSREQKRVEFKNTDLRLPEFKFIKDGKLELITEEFDIEEFTIEDEEDRECCICLNNYEEGAIIQLLECRHHMHKECINEWFSENNSCPTCRNTVFGVEI